MKSQKFCAVLLAGMGAIVATGCATSHRIGLDYRIHVDRDFGSEAVAETETFRSGEKFRLKVEPSEPGYLYVFNHGSSGRYHVLYPRPNINQGSARVTGGTTIWVPKSGAFQFDYAPGIERMILCFARSRVADLEDIAAGTVTDPSRITAILQRLEAERHTKGKFEKHYDNGVTELQLESGNEDLMIVNHVRLEHR